VWEIFNFGRQGSGVFFEGPDLLGDFLFEHREIGGLEIMDGFILLICDDNIDNDKL
jgi:hypothetical protein